jgi:hypothetical protein
MADLVLFKHVLESSIEIWRPVFGFPGYDISTMGRVRSWWVPRKPILSDTFRLLRQSLIRGYPKVSLHRNRKIHTFMVHLLVARAFISNPDNLPQVNHITAYAADPRAGNLEWVSPQGNADHARINGLLTPVIGSAHGMTKFNESDVITIRAMVANGMKQKEAAKLYKVDPSCIGLICRRKVWTHI